MRVQEGWALFLLLIFNVLMLSTVAIAFDLSIGTGRISYHDFYISSSIDTGLAHRIGGLGISAAFIAFLFIMFTRYVAVKALLSSFPASVVQRISHLSKFALVIEWFAALGALGVGAFNESFNYSIHMSFAFVCFGCAVASIFIQSYIDEVIAAHTASGLPRVALRWRVCRWSQCVLAVLGLFGMFSTGSLGFKEYSSLAELVMAFALFSYYLTWLASGGTGYIVGFEIFAFNRPEGASAWCLQSF